MSQPIRIPSQARATADALVQFFIKAGVDYEFLPIGGGGHPQVRMAWGRESRKMSFSATPSDKRRGSHNAVSQARRLCREMGWKKKEKVMKMGKQGMSMFDAQQASSGPASEARVFRPNGYMLKGVKIPEAPEGYVPTRGQRGWGNLLEERNAAMFEARQQGATGKEILTVVTAAGWRMKLQTVHTAISAEKYRRLDAAAAKDCDTPVKQAAAPQVKPTSIEPIDPLIIEIAKAIAPLLEKRFKVDPEISAKADKWDAIKGLINDA